MLQHQQQIHTADPKQFEVAFTVDPSKATALVAEIRDVGGVRNPILVWRDVVADKMHIIDGFHRTFAACQLGLTEISYILFDGTEQEFWDARIRESRPHTAIEADRINDWILAAWRAEFPNVSDDDMREMAYHVIKHGVKPPRKPLFKKQQEILAWLGLKAQAWRKTATEISDVIVIKSGVNHPDRKQVIEKTPDLKTAQVIVEGLAGAGVKSGATPTATPKDLGEYIADVQDKGDMRRFADWMAGKEEAKRKPPPPVEQPRIGATILARFSFFRYGKDRLQEVLALRDQFASVPPALLVEASEFYALARQVIEALGLQTGIATLAAEDALRTAQAKINDLEAENKRIKAELLAARALPNLALSESQMA